MMFLTARVNPKKLLLAAAVIAVVILAIVLFGGGGTQSTAAPAVSGNDARVDFLQGFGWTVATSPVQSGQVRIPEGENAVFDRYNELQKSQGYDLSSYAGKLVMRYVYRIENYPGATDPVYATVLVYKNKIIGGDVNDTSASGKISGFQMPNAEP